MAKTVSKRIADAFADADQKQVDEYLTTLRATWKDISDSLGRTAVTILILAAAFELLTHAAIKQFTVGPVVVSDTSLIQKLLPVLIAYLYFDELMLTVRWTDSRVVYEELMKKSYESIWDNDVHLFLFPRLPALWNLGSRTKKEVSGRHEELSSIMTIVLWIPALLFPIAFEVYALYRLFRIFSIQDILIWISAGVSTLLLAGALLIATQWAFSEE